MDANGRNQPKSAATGSGRVGTDDTTLIERVEPSSSGAVGDRLPVLSTVQRLLHVLEIPGHPHKVLMFRCRSPNKWRDAQLLRKREPKNVSSKPGLISDTS